MNIDNDIIVFALEKLYLQGEAALQRAEAAEKRCAELEAQLAKAVEMRDVISQQSSRLFMRAWELNGQLAEAQRVARVLELAWRHPQDVADADLGAALRTARAYPEQKPEPREPSDEGLRL